MKLRIKIQLKFTEMTAKTEIEIRINIPTPK